MESINRYQGWVYSRGGGLAVYAFESESWIYIRLDGEKEWPSERKLRGKASSNRKAEKITSSISVPTDKQQISEKWTCQKELDSAPADFLGTPRPRVLIDAESTELGPPMFSWEILTPWLLVPCGGYGEQFVCLYCPSLRGTHARRLLCWAENNLSERLSAVLRTSLSTWAFRPFTKSLSLHSALHQYEFFSRVSLIP